MRSCAPSKRKSGVDVFKSDDVSATAVDRLFDGVEGHTVSGVESDKILWFSCHFPSVDFDRLAKVREFLRKKSQSSHIDNQSADGSWFRTFQFVGVAEFFQFWIQFFFSEVGVFPPQSFDFL